MRRTILIVAFILTSFMRSAVADVQISLPDTTAFPRDTVNIPIKASDLSGLGIYSYEFKLNLNAKVARFIGVDSANTLTSSWGGTWVNASNPSQIRIGNFGIQPLKGSGVLIFLRFAIVGQIGDSTRLDLQDFLLNEGSIVVKVIDGSIKIIPNFIAVSFRTNLVYPVKIVVDRSEKALPFDTTWIAGESHIVSVITPHYQTDQIRCIFRKWSDGKDTTHVVTPISDTTFTVTMRTEYRLTVKSEYGHIAGNGWYSHGATVEFSADSLIFMGDTSRYIFKMWQGVGENSYTGMERTPNIVMTSPVTETALWRLQHKLQIQSSYGNPIGAGWHDKGDTVAIRIDSLVIPIAGTRHHFDAWSGTGNGSYSGNNIAPQVIMLTPIVERALWRTEHYLWIKSKPDGLIPSGKAGWYAKNSVAITNQADSTIRNERYVYKFQTWRVDEKAFASNPARIFMDTSHTAIASYKIDSALVKIESNIAGKISIAIDGSPQLLPYQSFWCYQSRRTIGIDTLQLAEDFKTRFKFLSWSDHGLPTHMIAADSALTLKVFLLPQYFLSVESLPSGLIVFAEKGWHNENRVIRSSLAPELIIAGKDTFYFKGWHLDGKPVSSNPIEIIMNAPHSAIALYQDLFFIKGRIADSKGNRIPGVRMMLVGAVQDTFESAADGDYYFNFLLPGTFKLVPEKNGFRFNPPFRLYPLLEKSQKEQNFIGIDLLAPHVELIYPNGGQNFIGGKMDSVIWLAEDNMGIDSIKFDLTSDGTTWSRIAAIHPGDQAKSRWEIPNITSSTCKLRICAVDYDGNQVSDESESFFAITAGTAVWDVASESLPEVFEIRPNYPNPFNSVTMFSVLLPEAGDVTARIVNLVGQEIVTLHEGKLAAGRHRMIWDGKDNFGRVVSSGVYFYRAEFKNQVETCKLLYLR